MTVQFRYLISAILILMCGASLAAAQKPEEKPPAKIEPKAENKPEPPKAAPLSEEERQNFQNEVRQFQKKLSDLPDLPKSPDAEIFVKGVVWALKYDQKFVPRDVNLLKKALKRANERLESLAHQQSPWTARRGKIALGFKSRIDSSVQPYGLIVPQNYDPEKRIRLDVVLHGSMFPAGMSELRFFMPYDSGNDEKDFAPSDEPFIELHPLGRVENCYRWAGETDVFEAINDVCRRYKIDQDRIVLRGMSAGASGTWHLGLKHPDFFVALGPYCGYVDTHKFSETPGMFNFVKVGPLPEHQELALDMLDSVDYAANAGVVPEIACMGEKDPFFQAHVMMGEAMQKEGLTMVNLISPGTGHQIDPKTQAEQMRRIGEIVEKGRNPCPPELHFVTWTLKYNRCDWLQVLGLEKHYERADISARLNTTLIDIDEPKNITKFGVLVGQIPSAPTALRIGGKNLPIPAAQRTTNSRGIVVVREKGTWKIAGKIGQVTLTGKRPGLQGPIDDAFTSAFLCVRGTGKPWNQSTQNYADAALRRFQEDFEHYMRGKIQIKDDTDVTPDDIAHKNLILFGDPGSNSLLAQALPQLPLKWTDNTVELGGKEYSTAEHVPVLIAPNPLSGGENHYLVVNSGHTFHAAEFSKVNYLLFPRWGDWAVLKIDPARAADAPAEETVEQAGYFDENFR